MPPRAPHEVRDSLIMVKSCTVLLCMLLACTCSYLKLVPRYKCLILDTYHPDTLYLCEKGCEDPWLFFDARRGLQAKMCGKHCSVGEVITILKSVKITEIQSVNRT